MKKRINALIALLVLLTVASTLTACFYKSEGEEIQFNHQPTEIKQNVENLANDKGFLMTLEIVAEATGNLEAEEESSEDLSEDVAEESGFDKITFAADHDKYYYYTQGAVVTEMIWDFSGENEAVVYTKMDEGWTKKTVPYTVDKTKEQSKEEAMQKMTDFFGYISGYYEEYNGQSMTKTSATVADRACDKYSVSVGILSYSIQYDITVDSETGICMSAGCSVNAGSIGSVGVTFLCTEFLTEYTISIPEVATTE